MQGRCLALLSESPLDLPNSQLLLRATRAKKKKSSAFLRFGWDKRKYDAAGCFSSVGLGWCSAAPAARLIATNARYSSGRISAAGWSRSRSRSSVSV